MGELISVILPTYNRSKTILRSICSVLNQTYSNIEVIVVDDGSTDDTVDLLHNIDPRVCIISQPNMGACVARNRGIEESHSEFIAFQDSDDEWLPDKLQKQMEVMLSHPEIDVCFCNALRLEQGNWVELLPSRMPNCPTKERLQSRSYVSTQTILVRREVLEHERFDPLMPRLQDYDLVFRLAEKYNFYCITKPLVRLYTQPDSISVNPEKAILARRRMLGKYKDELNILPHINLLKDLIDDENRSGKVQKEDVEALNRLKRQFLFQFNHTDSIRDQVVERMDIYLPKDFMKWLRGKAHD